MSLLGKIKHASSAMHKIHAPRGSTPRVSMPKAKPQHKVNVTMTVTQHPPDHFLRQAQLNDARRAIAAATPYRPSRKKQAMSMGYKPVGKRARRA